MSSIQKYSIGAAVGSALANSPASSGVTRATHAEQDTVSLQLESMRKVAQKTSESLEKSRALMESVAAELQRMAEGSGRSLGFQFVQSIDGPVITVSNTQTGEVIRQIPHEAVIRVADSIDRLKGILFDGIQ